MEHRMKQRDKYLDFYRGIAVISIIFIHTSFHSGESYVPNLVRTLSLLVDVPFFMFMTGWSAWYSHNPKHVFHNIVSICGFFFFFLLIIDFFLVFLDRPHLNNLNAWLQALLFLDYQVPDLPSVTWSIWYMPVYFTTILIGIFLIYIFDSSLKIKEWGRYVILFCFFGLVYVSFGEEKRFFLLSNQFLFYMFFFIAGFLTKNYKIKSFRNFLACCLFLLLMWFLSSWTYNIPAGELQNAKFPPHIMYCFASMISIVAALFFKGKIDYIVQSHKLIRKIGQNAIWYYFAQGIGASMLFKILPYIHLNLWYIKMIVAFVINLLVTFVIANLFMIIYDKTNFTRNKTRQFALNVIKKILSPYGMNA